MCKCQGCNPSRYTNLYLVLVVVREAALCDLCLGSRAFREIYLITHTQHSRWWSAMVAYEERPARAPSPNLANLYLQNVSGQGGIRYIIWVHVKSHSRSFCIFTTTDNATLQKETNFIGPFSQSINEGAKVQMNDLNRIFSLLQQKQQQQLLCWAGEFPFGNRKWNEIDLN